MSNAYNNTDPPRSPLTFTEANQADTMAPSDTKAPFQRIPWTARLINRPGLVFRVPGNRTSKADTEDSLFAEILKTSRTIRSCIAFYKKPAWETDPVTEATTLVTVGDGMNGHPSIIHGGIVATLIDESVGIYLSMNHERAHLAQVKLGKAEGELPPQGLGSFTAELKVTYLKPVQTPGAIAITAKRLKKEGRKEWAVVEVKQCTGHGEDDDGEAVVCATGEVLFIEPRRSKM